jgi:hypothetical protein
VVLIHSSHLQKTFPDMGLFIPYMINQKLLKNSKVFKAKVENQPNVKIKVVRSDRRGGGGIMGMQAPYGKIRGPFAKFLDENGIMAQYSMPGKPQRNGVAERQN